MDYKPTAKDIIALILIIVMFIIAGRLEYKTQQYEASMGYLTITETEG